MVTTLPNEMLSLAASGMTHFTPTGHINPKTTEETGSKFHKTSPDKIGV